MLTALHVLESTAARKAANSLPASQLTSCSKCSEKNNNNCIIY